MERLSPQSEPPPTMALVPVQRPSTNSPYPVYGDEDADDSGGSGLFQYWHILNRYKWIIVLSSVLGAILGILVGLPMTPVYRASTSLEVLNVNENFMNTKETSPVTTADFSYDVSEEETQVELLQGDFLQEKVFAKLDPNYAPGKMKRVASSGWRQFLHLADPANLTHNEALLDKAARSLKVKATPRTRIIEITADSTDPLLALNFVNTLTSEFIEQNVEARRKTTQKVSDWLGGEIEDARAKLRRAEDALQAYAGTSGLIFTDQDSEQTNIATEKLQQLQQALSAATADRITKQSSYELAQHGPPESLPDVLNDQSLRDEMTQINTLSGQIADMSEVFLPQYSTVRSAKARLVALQTAFEHDRAAVVERVKNDYEEAVRKEKLLASAYDSQTKEVLGQGAKAVQYNILKRDVDSSRQLYDTMLQQMKESSVAAALHASNVRVADPAQFPQKPVWPSFRILGLLGLFVGMFSSLGIVIHRERTDRTLQQPGEVQYWTRLLELGTIPSLAAMRTAKGYALPTPQRTFLGGTPTNGKSGKLIPPQLQTVDLVTWQRGESVLAEAFRSVLTSILFVGENGSSPRVLVFTSAGPGDGKTTVASNLAIAIAEIGRRILIIDADLRRPRQHNLFKVPNDCGLSDILKDHDFSSSQLKVMIQKTQVPGLHLLPSGPPTHAAANLLYSPNLEALLSQCKEDYDMVLIDTPPMLQLTDARVIGRMADGVVLVARAQQTTRDAIMAASQRFAEDRVRVLGTVLNDWNPKSSPTGYYGYNRGSYYTPYHHREASDERTL